MTTWCLRNDVFDSELVDEGFISLGWDDVGDLRQYGDPQVAIRQGLQRTLPDAKPGAVSMWAGMLRRFAFEMQKGDRIIAPVRRKSLLNFGIVSGALQTRPGVVHSHQRIYGQKVTLSHCGISMRGRARRLILNYRTTQRNLSWAMGILSGADWTDLEGETEAHTYHSAPTGPVPMLVPASTVTDEIDAAARLLRAWLPDPDADPA